MLKIAHTADVHIRTMARHDEYREILKAFTADCVEQKVDHIFVGGDIFHTKTTGISPEYIDLLTWWLLDMASIAEVHMILGNHDGNLVNLSRQDAVTPIVNAINSDKIKLYKKSGVYPIAPGYNWCVFSPFDEENWASVRPVDGEVNIACFHGGVLGSTTESGWDVEASVGVEFFESFDYAMLGDIHKRQTLGYREGKPWIAYPGTPIQQNYSEELEHGYLLWQLNGKKEWDVKFRKLPNLKPFVTVQWEESNEHTLKLASKFPKNSRVRIKSKSALPQADVQYLTTALKRSLDVSEVTFKHEVKFETLQQEKSQIERKNLRDEKTVLTLLKSFSKENGYKVNWDSVVDETKKYLSLVEDNQDFSRGTIWSLKHMRWDNTFSYCEDNQINFEKLSGIVGIFGANRTGKSSVIGTLLYSLFNTSDRGTTKNVHTCNVRKDYCSARSIFDLSGTTYVVERQTTKSYNKKGALNAPTVLNLFKLGNDGELEDLCGEQRTETEKTLRNLIGTAEDFMLTSLSVQGESDAFITLSSPRRRLILSKFLDLDIFDKMHEFANRDFNSFKSRLKSFPERDWDGTIKSLEDQLATAKKRIKECEFEISEKQQELSELKNSFISTTAVVPVTELEVELQRKKVEAFKEQSKECSNKIESTELEIQELNKKIETVKNILESDDIDDLKKTISTIAILEKSIQDLRRSHELESIELKKKQRSIKLLDEVPCGDKYKSCKFIKDAHTDKLSLDEQAKKEFSTRSSLENAESSLVSLEKEKIQAKISRHEKAKSLMMEMKVQVSKKEVELEKARNSCEELMDRVRSAVEKLSKLEEAAKNEENYEVNLAKEKIKKISKELKELDDAKLCEATLIGKLTSDIDKLQSDKKNRESLLSEMQTLEMICNAFSKKGLPLTITKTQLPSINFEIAKILHGIVDFTIELENDDETDSTEIYINYGDSKRIIELCSGMEKTIASIALRVALSNVSSLPKPDMFLIDEGFGTLDETGVEACNRLLVSLKKFFRLILVITHVDGIKDIVDNFIEITKVEKDAQVVLE